MEVNRQEVVIAAAALVCTAVIVAYNAFSAPPLIAPVVVPAVAVSLGGAGTAPAPDSSAHSGSSDGLSASNGSGASATPYSQSAGAPELSSADESSGEIVPVNVNTADLTALQTLPGVGPVLAQRIIDYRRVHGPFLTVDDLKKVSGIGDRMFESIKAYIVLS